jgi:hypothetical protein
MGTTAPERAMEQATALGASGAAEAYSGDGEPPTAAGGAAAGSAEADAIVAAPSLPEAAETQHAPLAPRAPPPPPPASALALGVRSAIVLKA